MMTERTVSVAGPADAAELAELLADMDRFYGTGPAGPLAERIRQVRDALFASPPAAQALLARDGGRVAGLATYSVLWPAAGLTRSLYLKELYVAGRYRGRGIGTLLMRAIFGLAAETGCSRVEWTADRDNAAAQSFYERLGVQPQPSKVFYRTDTDHGEGT